MANVNAPFGMRPIRYLDGRPYNGAVDHYFVTGATGAIYVGDPVVEAGAANTTEVLGFPPGSLQTATVGLAGDNDTLTGVCVAVLPTNRDSTPYRVDSTDRVIAVARGPDLIFEVQADAGGTALAGANVGLHAVLAAGSGSTVTGQSGWALDTATAPADDPSYQLKILSFSKNPKNEIGAYAVVEVLINNHMNAQVADGGRATAIA
jgi:hypothetical protein